MTNGDELAFAFSNASGDIGAEGLTKREYFAILVLQGLLASGLGQAKAQARSRGEKDIQPIENEAVLIANDLIKALNQEAK